MLFARASMYRAPEVIILQKSLFGHLIHTDFVDAKILKFIRIASICLWRLTPGDVS